MSQENPNSTANQGPTPTKPSPNDQFTSRNENMQTNCTPKSHVTIKSDSIANYRKSCLRNSNDAKQNERHVKFSSPIAHAQNFFIFRSSKSLNRLMYPPKTFPSVVYKGTRLQQERQRQQIHQEPVEVRPAANEPN